MRQIELAVPDDIYEFLSKVTRSYGSPSVPEFFINMISSMYVNNYGAKMLIEAHNKERIIDKEPPGDPKDPGPLCFRNWGELLEPPKDKDTGLNPNIGFKKEY